MTPNRDSEVPLRLGTETQWGAIGAVGLTGGERYYWMVDKHGSVAMMPACVVEPTIALRALDEKRKK